jgi:hypothetical protein
MACKLTPEQLQTILKANAKGADKVDLVRAIMEPTFREKFFEYYNNTLLSAPPSWAAKASGDVGEQLMSLAQRVGSIAIDKGTAWITGRAPEREWTEIGAHLNAIQEYLPQSLSGVAKYLARPFTSAESDLRYPGYIEGTKGDIIRTPGRIFSQLTDTFQGLSSRIELYTQASRIAWQRARAQGIAGADLPKFLTEQEGAIRKQVFDAVSNGGDASSLPPDLAHIPKAMTDAANYRTLLSRLPQVLDSLGRARDTDPTGISRVLMPFWKVPVNLGLQALEATPLNFIRLAHKAYTGELKGGALSDELAKPLLGTLVMGAFGAAAHAGLVTGSGPEDPKTRADLMASGWQPYSLHDPISGSYLSYHRFEPLASVMGLAADSVEALNEKTAGAQVQKGIEGISRNLTSRTFLTTLSNALDALHDPVRFGGKLLSGVEGSAVPGIVSHVATAIDPVQRQTSPTDFSAVEARLPGVSTLLPAKRTALGEERAPLGRESALERFASPFPRSSDNPDADLERELANIGYVPSTPANYLRMPNSRAKVPLSPEEVQGFMDARKSASDRARQLIQMPEFQALPDREDDAPPGYPSKVSVLRNLYKTYEGVERRKRFLDPAFQQRARDLTQQQKGA